MSVSFYEDGRIPGGCQLDTTYNQENRTHISSVILRRSSSFRTTQKPEARRPAIIANSKDFIAFQRKQNKDVILYFPHVCYRIASFDVKATHSNISLYLKKMSHDSFSVFVFDGPTECCNSFVSAEHSDRLSLHSCGSGERDTELR